MKLLNKKNWMYRTYEGAYVGCDDAKVQDIAEQVGLSALTVQCCFLRGFDTLEKISNYLRPKLSDLKNPFLIEDMHKAVARVFAAFQNKENIFIFGDYDVDGTAGVALLKWFFDEVAIPVSILQPNRFVDGYGLQVASVQGMIEQGAQLIITVDCGITSFAAIAYARNLGVDVMVIDHHQVDTVRGLPLAHAILNPQRQDCKSQLKELCGCGVAFYFIRALRSQCIALGWFTPERAPNLKTHLDLVLMATAADMVPLLGDNHILMRYGMEVLKASKKPGVKVLLELLNIQDKKFSLSSLGFQIAPLINAAGRIASAASALELLTTKDVQQAYLLGAHLIELNQQRMLLQGQIWDHIRGVIEEKLSQGLFAYAIVIADAAYHEGVIGIVASRVTESFQRPAIIGHVKDDGTVKASCRTYAGKDLLIGLKYCSELLVQYGGHRYAAGCNFRVEVLENFIVEFNNAMRLSPEDATQKAIFIESEVTFDQFTFKVLKEIEAMGPFGPANPEPVFLVKAAAQTKRVLKDRHLKLKLRQESDILVDAIWFNAMERADVQEDFCLEKSFWWVGVPELDRFYGSMNCNLRIRDWQTKDICQLHV